MFAQGGAFGMEKTVDPAHEIGENVTITERSQLLSITPEQAKKIKSLRIENQILDGGISFYALFPDDNIEQIYFNNCSFSGWDLWILSSFPSVSRIGFTRCGLRGASLKKLLNSSNPYETMELLDLSGNNFETPLDFVDVFKSTVFGVRSIKTLVLSDNGFGPMIVPLLQGRGGVGEVVL